MMKIDPRPERLDATLWIPKDLDVAVLELVSGRLSRTELESMTATLEDRLGLPTLITTAINIEVRRYE